MLRFVSGGVGFNSYLPIALWLAAHLHKRFDRPLVWIDYHVTARGFRDGILRVAHRDAELCLVNSRGLAAMAQRGTGLFDEPIGNLRGLATFPHHDWCVFAVRRSLGISTFEELREAKVPLKLTTGFLDGDNAVGTLAIEVMRRHGIDPTEFVEEWGGEIIEAGLSGTRENIENGTADAICQEAAYSPRFRTLMEREDLVCLSMDPAVTQRLDEDFGFGGMTVPAGYYANHPEPFEALDFSAWILCGRDDLDADLAAAIAETVLDNGRELEESHLPLITGVTFRQSLPELKPGEVVDTIPVPLHPGARGVYEGRGLQ